VTRPMPVFAPVMKTFVPESFTGGS
jgi:hypothetical protein